MAAIHICRLDAAASHISAAPLTPAATSTLAHHVQGRHRHKCTQLQVICCHSVQCHHCHYWHKVPRANAVSRLAPHSQHCPYTRVVMCHQPVAHAHTLGLVCVRYALRCATRCCAADKFTDCDCHSMVAATGNSNLMRMTRQLTLLAHAWLPRPNCLLHVCLLPLCCSVRLSPLHKHALRQLTSYVTVGSVT
jgi:hypothetical protein